MIICSKDKGFYRRCIIRETKRIEFYESFVNEDNSFSRRVFLLGLQSR